MSLFTTSQSARLCAAVDEYAKRQGFIAGGESVPVQTFNMPRDHRLLRFAMDGDFYSDHSPDVLVVDNAEDALFDNRVIFPCGQQLELDGLVKKVAKAVVHELFGPQ